MIYGDSPGKNSRPSFGAITQSGNLYAYCMNNPLSFIDDTGELAYLGEIHNAVVDHIYNKYSKYAEKGGKMPLHKEQKILYTEEQRKHFYSKSGSGRADLLCEDGRIWEVKPNNMFQVIRGVSQVNRYITGYWFKNETLDLTLGDSYITSGQFEHLSGETIYTVSYGYIGNGLIVYNYDVKDVQIDLEKVKIGVLVVVSAAAAATLFTAAVVASGGSLAPLYLLLI